jgi:glucose-1-phosphate thymidylyltransferase
MHALILAGGFATRLYPLTKDFPKALLAVRGKPLLSYLVDDLGCEKSIDRIILVSNARHLTSFRIWIGNNGYCDDITILNNGVTDPEKRLGAIGDLLYVIHKERINDDLLVLSSDTYSSLKICDFVRFFGHHRGVINAVFETRDPDVIAGKLGCVTVSGFRITGFTEKPDHPQSTITSIPYYIFPKETLPLVETYRKEAGPVDAPGSIIPFLIGKVPVYAFRIGEGFYHDIGTHDVYNRFAGG